MKEPDVIQQELVCEKGHPLEENKLGMKWCALCDETYTNPLAKLPTDTDVYITGAGYGVWTDTGEKVHALRHPNSKFTICGEVRGEALHEKRSRGSSDFCGSCDNTILYSNLDISDFDESKHGADSVDVDIEDF